MHRATDIKVLSYADDTTLYYSDSNINRIYEKVNIELKKVYNWLCSNKLLLNIGKTKFMIFGPKNSQRHDPGNILKINDKSLTLVGTSSTEKYVKFLGLYLDENLSWEGHIKCIHRKISQALFCVQRLKNVLPMSVLKTIYFSTIQSHLTYGLSIWGASCHVSLLRTIQKKALRAICKLKFNSHTNKSFCKNFILKLDDLYEYRVAGFMYDYTRNLLPESFREIFPRTNHGYGTRNATNLAQPVCRTAFSQSLPKYKFPIIWKKFINLANHVNSKSVFLSRVKQKIIEGYSNIQEGRCVNPGCPDCVF
jgi:hypothetical protein